MMIFLYDISCFLLRSFLLLATFLSLSLYFFSLSLSVTSFRQTQVLSLPSALCLCVSLSSFLFSLPLSYPHSLPLSRTHRWQCETLSNLINSLRTETFARFVPFSNLPENSTHTQTGTHTGTDTVRHTEKVLYLRILSSIS